MPVEGGYCFFGIKTRSGKVPNRVETWKCQMKPLICRTYKVDRLRLFQLISVRRFYPWRTRSVSSRRPIACSRARAFSDLHTSRWKSLRCAPSNFPMGIWIFWKNPCGYRRWNWSSGFFWHFFEKHLMPKWLLFRRANLLSPALLSTNPCAKLILAGTPNFSISSTATCENCAM